jgi:ribosome-associated translation inhibitor RaiA/cold shock CspA family protein
MQTPLRITAHDLTLSDKTEKEIRDKVAKLETFYPRLVGCHVVVSLPARYASEKAAQFNVNIDLTAPGAELTVTHKANHDLSVAIREAFTAARRQLRRYARRQRGDVKSPEAPPHAVVSTLFPAEGYGFLVTHDGREIYFHQNSVRDGKFSHLAVGAEVRFVEESGEKGPQASTVTPVGRI